MATTTTTPQEFPALTLSPKQELALLHRVLYAEGYDDHITGHMLYKQPDGTFLATPSGLTWDEARASDIARVDGDGNHLEGPWTVTPATALERAVYAVKPDANVVLHAHPRYATIWAGAYRVPPAYDQLSALARGVVVLTEYGGAVSEIANADHIAKAMGDADAAILGNHGVLVSAPDIEGAYARASGLEQRCRLAYQVESIGGGTPLPAEDEEWIDGFFRKRTGVAGDYVRATFEAAARRVIRQDAGVLD